MKTIHRVQPGDRFSSIAEAYGVAPHQLLDANPAKPRVRTLGGAEVFASLEAGEELAVPGPRMLGASMPNGGTVCVTAPDGRQDCNCGTEYSRSAFTGDVPWSLFCLPNSSMTFGGCVTDPGYIFCPQLGIVEWNIEPAVNTAAAAACAASGGSWDGTSCTPGTTPGTTTPDPTTPPDPQVPAKTDLAKTGTTPDDTKQPLLANAKPPNVALIAGVGLALLALAGGGIYLATRSHGKAAHA